MTLKCFDVLVCDETYAQVQKTADAIAWEKQKNECVEYQCDDRRGIVTNVMCNSELLYISMFYNTSIDFSFMVGSVFYSYILDKC